MLNDIAFYTFMVVSAINLAHLGFYLVGANIYDIKQFRRMRMSPKHRRVAPLVSVLIPAHNEGVSIIDCLDSVRRSSYRKLQIIVIDDASTDNTRQLIRDYIAKYPTRPISLMYRQKNQGKASALNHALRRRAKGDLVMTLDGDSILHKDAIKRAVAYFDDPQIAGVAANVKIMDSQTILGLLQKFEHMAGYRSKKFYSLSNSEYIIGGVASTYRRSILQKVKFYDHDTLTEDIGLSLKITALGNKDQRLTYGADVMAMTEGVHTFKALIRQRYRWKMGGLQNIFKHTNLLGRTDRYSRMLTYYRLPMAFFGEVMLLIEPLLMAYILYLSIISKNPALFTGAYMMISVYLLLVLLPDEHTNSRKKIELMTYVPILYFIFFIMNVVQLVSIFRCLKNYKQFLGKAETASSWVSPERLGRQAS